jgi:hypothetical protein
VVTHSPEAADELHFEQVDGRFVDLPPEVVVARRAYGLLAG